jgi:hypothetical protein
MTPGDRDRIAANSVTVTETPFSAVPSSEADPRPESLRLQFRILDPQNGAPQLRMIFPGVMRFEPDPPVAPDVLPSIGHIQMTGDTVEQVSFERWPERGKLRVEATEEQVVHEMTRDNTLDGIGRPAQIAWFEPVLMTLDFLNSAVLNGLERKPFVLDAGTPNAKQITGQTQGWAEHAVVRFYEGRYQPRLKINRDTPPNRELDDVIQFPMPRFPMTTTGEVDIRITIGVNRTKSDIDDYAIANTLNLPDHHPGHPNVETLPTRAFWQRNRAQMIGADAENATVDAIVGADTFPQDMKASLTEFGFGNLGPANNIFNERAHWAVREFQIYSKYRTVATEPNGSSGEYANRLQAQANPLPYTGPINGFLNVATRERMDIWGRPANRLRCPVVVTARTGEPQYQAVQPGSENIWVYNELSSEVPRIFVRDVSGYYDLPALDARDVTVGGNRFIVLATYQPPVPSENWPGGPNMLPQHSWSTMALNSLRLTGVNETTLFGAGGNPAMLSTYMTILHTIQRETHGRFDIANAYDSATLSMPLFHYTFRSGELGALFAYFEDRAAGDFVSAIAFFGLKPASAWANVTRFQGKRTSWLQNIQAAGDTYRIIPKDADQTYFKSWHWFYRAVMANRIFDTFKTNGYDYARWRLSDMRECRIENRPSGNGATQPVGTNSAVPTLGQVFTSERSLAMLLRWHVNRPSDIVDGDNAPGSAGAELWGALARAQDPTQNGNLNLMWTGDVATWTDDHETALINGIVEEARALTSKGKMRTNVRDDIIRIRDTFAEQARRPSATRGSFQLHAPPNGTVGV